MAIFKHLFPNTISSVAATAAEASRSATIDVRTLGAESVGFAIKLTRVAGTALVATIWKSADGGSTSARVPSMSTASGAATANDYTVTKSISTSGEHTMWQDVPCLNCTHVKLVVGVTGGGTSDLISVDACAGGVK